MPGSRPERVDRDLGENCCLWNKQVSQTLFLIRKSQIIEQTALGYFAGSRQCRTARILRVNKLARYRRNIRARNRIFLLRKLQFFAAEVSLLGLQLIDRISVEHALPRDVVESFSD